MIGAWVRWATARGYSSWHVVTGFRRDGSYGTRCGRTAPASSAVSDFLPTNDRSCEKCLALSASDERADTDEVPG